MKTILIAFGKRIYRAAHAKAGTKDFALNTNGIEKSISLLKFGVGCKDNSVDEAMLVEGRNNIEELNRLLGYAVLKNSDRSQ